MIGVYVYEDARLCDFSSDPKDYQYQYYFSESLKDK